jgi:hypothetical protein
MFKSNPTSPSLRHPFRAALRAAVTLTVLTGCIAFADAQSTEIRPPALNTIATPLFSSSSDQTAATTDGTTTEASLNPASGVNFANYMQYGGGQRRRYGSPRYRGNNTNADGSPKYSFFAGAGLAQPTGNTWHYLTPSYGLQIGGGRNFNAKLGLMLQFDYDHFGFTGQTIANQFNILNSQYVYNGQLASIDGSSHVWSFTVDPVFNVVQGKTTGFYLVAGAGFFHKTANFTTPATGTYCDYYYGCYQYQANQTIDKYTSNAPGFDGGFGLTYKFSRFSNERFYVEARYVFVDNSHRAGIQPTNAGIASITATTTNLYPANSNRTTYIPVKVGLRF